MEKINDSLKCLRITKKIIDDALKLMCKRYKVRSSGFLSVKDMSEFDTQMSISLCDSSRWLRRSIDILEEQN